MEYILADINLLLLLSILYVFEILTLSNMHKL